MSAPPWTMKCAHMRGLESDGELVGGRCVERRHRLTSIHGITVV